VPKSADEDVIRAAGGVVWRRAGDRIEVVLVHRPAYNDWSFPKGKLTEAESDEEAARREVLEETGLVCRLGPDLGRRSYRDRRGRPKVVRYWAVEPIGGTLAPTMEVDRAEWVSVDAAASRLTHDDDRSLLGILERTIGMGSSVGGEPSRPRS
jgi:8-oxo-dGTP diphosphatase